MHAYTIRWVPRLLIAEYPTSPPHTATDRQICVLRVQNMFYFIFIVWTNDRNLWKHLRTNSGVIFACTADAAASNFFFNCVRACGRVCLKTIDTNWKSKYRCAFSWYLLLSNSKPPIFIVATITSGKCSYLIMFHVSWGFTLPAQIPKLDVCPFAAVSYLIMLHFGQKTGWFRPARLKLIGMFISRGADVPNYGVDMEIKTCGARFLLNPISTSNGIKL